MPLGELGVLAVQENDLEPIPELPEDWLILRSLRSKMCLSPFSGPERIVPSGDHLLRIRNSTLRNWTG